ncbi:RalBP1-associated Eps domain-containing protein 1 [Chionoecetes opilio]|uniref:RalBP1-associated Eps domain-containing protein 1 n=1 Tax=Chionoecetes opilio TaxID=41210 RepID=A0A8J5CGG5_CHIOP|nr:RalBP1-associated Eps domain-containing protein 1 [Chionoecetes opilio]
MKHKCHHSKAVLEACPRHDMKHKCHHSKAVLEACPRHDVKQKCHHSKAVLEACPRHDMKHKCHHSKAVLEACPRHDVKHKCHQSKAVLEACPRHDVKHKCHQSKAVLEACPRHDVKHKCHQSKAVLEACPRHDVKHKCHHSKAVLEACPRHDVKHKCHQSKAVLEACPRHDVKHKCHHSKAVLEACPRHDVKHKCHQVKMVDGGYRMMESEDGEGADERMSDPSGRMVSHSTSVSSPASDSPTPTNSVHEKTWNQTHTHWHGLINDEHRQLLGTEEDSSEGRSSGEEEYNVWSVTEEQRNYYTEQFRSMQPDLTALLSGTTAKEFFEKSKLPVNELSKIWQLSDVTRDGSLSLQEFFTAMHLVVLRRNNIELPETLPPSLYPVLLRKSSSSGVEGGGNSGASGHSSVGPGGTAAAEGEAGGTKATPDPLSPSRNKEWTKFVDSPTSTLSSPGLKPVNFDFQKSALEQDPKILHPKAVRLTPESKRLEVSDIEGPASFSPEAAPTTDPPNPPPAPAPPSDLQPAPPTTTGPASSQGSPKKTQEGQDIKPIQRPLPRKPTGSSTGVLPPPPQAAVTTPPDDAGMFGPISLPSIPSGPLPAGAKKEAPPPPPPRPARTHTRSSSLDLNKFSRNSFLGAPPAVPPRASPGATSPKKLIYQKSDGDMAGVEGGGGGGEGIFPLDTRPQVERARTSAFEVYRKPHQELCSAFERVSGQRVGEEEERTRHLSMGARPKDKREIQASIRTTTEKNTILTRLNSELNQELAEVRTKAHVTLGPKALL